MSSFDDAIERQKRIRAFMCGVDWEEHLANDSYGTKLYPTEATVRERRKCVNQCGIVEVEVRIIRWVQEQDFSQLTPAQGIEAEGRDPSSGLDAQRESPVANGDAPQGSNPP